VSAHVFNLSDLTGTSVAHAPVVRRIQTNASSPTHRLRNLGHRCVGADRRAVLLCGSRPRMAATQRAGGMVVKGLSRRPIASIYTAALAACCATRRMVRQLKCRRFGLRASNQCLDGFLWFYWLRILFSFWIVFWFKLFRISKFVHIQNLFWTQLFLFAYEKCSNAKKNVQIPFLFIWITCSNSKIVQTKKVFKF
jgi:hypothetical protein